MSTQRLIASVLLVPFLCTMTPPPAFALRQVGLEENPKQRDAFVHALSEAAEGRRIFPSRDSFPDYFAEYMAALDGLAYIAEHPEEEPLSYRGGPRVYTKAALQKLRNKMRQAIIAYLSKGFRSVAEAHVEFARLWGYGTRVSPSVKNRDKNREWNAITRGFQKAGIPAERTMTARSAPDFKAAVSQWLQGLPAVVSRRKVLWSAAGVPGLRVAAVSWLLRAQGYHEVSSIEGIGPWEEVVDYWMKFEVITGHNAVAALTLESGHPPVQGSTAAVLCKRVPVYRSSALRGRVDSLISRAHSKINVEMTPYDYDGTKRTKFFPGTIVVYNSQTEAVPAVPNGVALVDWATVSTFDDFIKQALAGWTGLPVSAYQALSLPDGRIAIFV